MTTYAPRPTLPTQPPSPVPPRRNYLFQTAVVALLLITLVTVIVLGLSNRNKETTTVPAQTNPAASSTPSAAEVATAKQLTCQSLSVNSFIAVTAGREAKNDDPTWNSVINPRISNATTAVLVTLTSATPSEVASAVREWAAEMMRYSAFYASKTPGKFDGSQLDAKLSAANKVCGLG